MDTPTIGDAVRALVTDGEGEFYESEYVIPPLGPGDILVKAAMTGVCRSDIDMMNGEFDLLPHSMHGHEGLGIDVATGKFYATRGEPAYADYYVARSGTYVEVPELDPKYILEPVACAANLYCNSRMDFWRKNKSEMVIIGTGFLAKTFYQTLQAAGLQFDYYVIGNSNKDWWSKQKYVSFYTPDDMPDKDYDVVVNLSHRSSTFFNCGIKDNGLMIIGAPFDQPIATDFSEMIWKNVTTHCPSPRSKAFSGAMAMAKLLVNDGRIRLDDFWTRSYNRETEWQKAFEDANKRPEGYNRGYITWV